MRNFWAAPTDLFATLDRYWFVDFPPTHSLPIPSLTVYSAATLHA